MQEALIPNHSTHDLQKTYRKLVSNSRQNDEGQNVVSLKAIRNTTIVRRALKVHLDVGTVWCGKNRKQEGANRPLECWVKGRWP